MRRQHGFGLTVECEVAIHGFVPIETNDGEDPDVNIAWSCGEAAVEPILLYQYADGCLTFAPPGIGQFHIRPGSIDVHLLPSANADQAHMLLIATALPALLWLRGGFMLHAAAIVMPGTESAIAIVGPSGCGKSTIANDLIAQGAKLLADDSICLRQNGQAIWGSGLPGGLFVHNDGQRHFQPFPIQTSLPNAPISCIVVLEETDSTPNMTRLSGLEATRQLLLHRHRPAVPALLGLTGRGIEFTTRLATSIPVLAWRQRNHWQDFDSRRFLDDIALAYSGDRQ
jgi:hypothetical protein